MKTILSFLDISTALQLLEHIQHTIDTSDDVKLQTQTADDLNLLISVLENPIFRSIVTIQVSFLGSFFLEFETIFFSYLIKNFIFPGFFNWAKPATSRAPINTSSWLWYCSNWGSCSYCSKRAWSLLFASWITRAGRPKSSTTLPQ